MGLFSFFKKKNTDNDEVLNENENLQENVQSSVEENIVEEAPVVEDTAEQEIKAEISEDTVLPDEKAVDDTPALEETDVQEATVENAQAKPSTEENTVDDTVALEETDVQDATVENAQAKPSTEENTVEDTVALEETDIQEATVENAQEETAVKETPEKVKLSFFERLKRTRENLAYGISALVKGKKIDDDLYEDLETALLTADLGVETTDTIIERLKDESKLRDLHDAGALKVNLKNILKEILEPCAQPLNVKKEGDSPYVILMVGVNGAGKTTTIGKLALKYKSQGMKVMLAAGDTFRAAAVEQLKEWGKRTDTPVISQPTGSDSASVIFDALNAAKARKADVLICDTAGRLQNKDNLMEELKKIVRVMKKIDENVPNEVMLVLDATTGQNAVSQMKIFKEAVNVSGLCLTKLDGTAKGGVVFCLADKFKIPVRYIGIGEKTEDLRNFNVDNFVDALID
ncbi:MAG: signal recognition particle-docking protein FtsY [Succinivibrio sp.]|nr:signal recognition particle-docking protein FtsY [Succinivibrio sp.]